MNSVNSKNMGFIIIFVVLLIICGIVTYLSNYDDDSIYAKISNGYEER